jgi:formate hydrogenlyase subunit 3/multisubunit Na+/H+ antiporter MnhD subunit
LLLSLSLLDWNEVGLAPVHAWLPEVHLRIACPYIGNASGTLLNAANLVYLRMVKLMKLEQM